MVDFQYENKQSCDDFQCIYVHCGRMNIVTYTEYYYIRSMAKPQTKGKLSVMAVAH